MNETVHLCSFLALCSLLLTGVARAADEGPFQVEVNILSASIKAGSEPIGAAQRETVLTAYQFNGSYYLVDLPNSNPPRQGWIAKDDVHRVVDKFAVLEQRIAAFPADQRGKAKQQTMADMEKLAALETKFDELLRQGKPREALVAARHLVADSRELFGEHHPLYANECNNLGLTATAVGDYATARQQLEVALAIYRDLVGERHADTADALNNLGDAALRAGDYPAARKYDEQALAIRRAVFGEQDKAVASSLHNLGTLADAEGDLLTARKDYEQALAIKLAVLGVRKHSTASTLHNLGFVVSETGDFAAAFGYYQRALAIQYEVLGERHLECATTLNSLGRLAVRVGDNSAAGKYFGQALAIQRAALDKQHPAIADSLHNLGVVAQNSDDYSSARNFYEQALAMRRVVLGDKHPDTAVTWNNLGTLAADEGDYATAIHDYEQALADYRQVYGETHPDIAGAEANLANPEAASGKWPAAAQSMQQARRIARRYVGKTLTGLTEKDQLAFLLTSDNWRFYCGLSLGFARRDDPNLAAASAAWLLNGKAVALEALSERTRLARAATSPATAELVARLLSLRGQLATLSLTSPPPNQRETWQAQLAALTAQEDELTRRLGASNADIGQADPWIALDELRRKLPSDAMLVDIGRFPRRNISARNKTSRWQDVHYAAWLIPPAGKGEVRIVDLGEAEPIDAAVQAARRSLSAGNGAVPLKGLKFDDTDSQAADRWQAALAALAARIWQPLEPHLATTREVIISPDAALWLVPWAALRSGDGRQFALEKWRIRYVTSGRDIALTGGSAAERNDGAAIFADPDFDLGPQQTVANTAAILGELANPPAGSEPPFGAVPQAALAGAPGSVRTAGPLGSAPRLPGTAKEAAAIRTPLAKYAGAAPRMLLDQQALEGVLRRVKRPRVLVLSTHGYFLPDQETKPDNGRPALNNERRSVALDTGGTPIENPLLRCGLLLAGCNRRNELTAAGADDGVLTGLEIVGCDLRGTDLVVLSACETGIGEVHNGEGVAGLRQAFQLAGAHAVVASLWRVPDAETSQLMSDFFANLAAGQSKADALRNAQLSMVQASRQRGGSAPPFFWAAFTLTGN